MAALPHACQPPPTCSRLGTHAAALRCSGGCARLVDVARGDEVQRDVQRLLANVHVGRGQRAQHVHQRLAHHIAVPRLQLLRARRNSLHPPPCSFWVEKGLHVHQQRACNAHRRALSSRARNASAQLSHLRPAHVSAMRPALLQRCMRSSAASTASHALLVFKTWLVRRAPSLQGGLQAQQCRWFHARQHGRACRRSSTMSLTLLSLWLTSSWQKQLAAARTAVGACTSRPAQCTRCSGEWRTC